MARAADMPQGSMLGYTGYPQSHVYSDPMAMTLFGNRAFAVVIR